MEQCMWIADILHFEKVTRQSGKYLDMELPFYLMWEKDGFAVFLRLVDLQTMIEEKRIVYLIGAASVNNYFKNEMTPLPTLVFPYMSEKCRDLIQSLTDERKHLFCQSQEEINLYYEKNAEQIIQNIQNGLPRILFLTSRFTTAVQYYFRDMADAACRAGCKCVVVKEENALQRVNPVSLIAQINRLKPDVVVCVDHFRFEEIDVPKQLVWITWIQDPLPDIMNPETPSKLLATDVVINQFYSWKKLTDIYRDIDMMDASVPTNPLIYKPYKLSPQEWEAYGADIAIVCHFTPSEKAMLDLLKDIPEELSNTLRSLHMDYYQMLYETGKPLCGEKAFAEYVFKEWQKYEGVVSDKDDLMPLVNHMATTYGQWTFRENLAHWILDAGFENLKLWGNGWNQIERFRPYAMGPAPNGEILSKIYQASKIVLGSNSVCTAATRAGEAMMSGGFYLANYLPPEADWVDLRMQLEEDRDFVMYNGRDDLIEKLHYYLEHEEERKCMAEAERKAALKHMTFDSFIQRFLKEVPHILEKQLQKEEISELPK
ncbi:MAG: glycosyltransferase family 1 protein [Lachnospiraceae bacterium]|nr:glycosyltransferase family 1 protein [Lachnospiraceae bacterium]